MKIPQLKDMLSWVPILARPHFGAQELAFGTAFLYRHSEKVYLITNWHNVTGREPVSYKPKHSLCAVPDELVIAIPYDTKTEAGSTIACPSTRTPITGFPYGL